MYVAKIGNLYFHSKNDLKGVYETSINIGGARFINKEYPSKWIEDLKKRGFKLYKITETEVEDEI
jgi:hypothetical protein